jgi:hypothetical protein
MHAAIVGAFTNRRYWPLCAFWLVVMVYDAVTRLANPFLGESVSGVELGALVVEPQTRLKADLYATLNDRLNRQRASPSEMANESVVLPADAEGDESYIWHSPANAYRLLGLFKRGERFAVLERISLDGVRLELIDVRVGDELDGYRLASIAERSLEARNGAGEVIALRLFEASLLDQN